MAKPQKILYLTGTRADFGLMSSVLHSLNEADGFSVEVLATGMHLMPQFGNTIEQVKQAGFPVHILDAVFAQDSKASMASFLGEVVHRGTSMLAEIQPDMVLLLGDRAEMLAGAIMGAYLYLPTIHIGGGDNTSTIDNSVRHAITRLAHLHFPATEASRQRLVDSGEDAWRCFNAGAPALDAILQREFEPREEFFRRMGFQSEMPVEVVILHPESLHEDVAADQMRLALESAFAEDRQTVVIYPNADAGGRQMIEVIEGFRGRPGLFIYPSLPYEDYLHVLRHADLLIGNSSSGILEAPSFGLPVLNLGDRQKGREKAENILDVPFEAEPIRRGLQKLRNDEAFLSLAKEANNPYSHGGCGKTILEVLETIEWSDRWLQK